MLTVTRTEGHSGKVTLHYFTQLTGSADDERIGGERYESVQHRQVLFSEGVVRRQISVQLKDNLAVDGNATFVVQHLVACLTRR